MFFLFVFLLQNINSQDTTTRYNDEGTVVWTINNNDCPVGSQGINTNNNDCDCNIDTFEQNYNTPCCGISVQQCVDNGAFTDLNINGYEIDGRPIGDGSPTVATMKSIPDGDNCIDVVPPYIFTSNENICSSNDRYIAIATPGNVPLSYTGAIDLCRNAGTELATINPYDKNFGNTEQISAFRQYRDIVKTCLRNSNVQISNFNFDSCWIGALAVQGSTQSCQLWRGSSKQYGNYFYRLFNNTLDNVVVSGGILNNECCALGLPQIWKFFQGGDGQGGYNTAAVANKLDELLGTGLGSFENNFNLGIQNTIQNASLLYPGLSSSFIQFFEFVRCGGEDRESAIAVCDNPNYFKQCPTTNPTPAPVTTRGPTVKPTPNPSNNPTINPTPAPVTTRGPTKKPSINPTNKPTLKPTNNPSITPTDNTKEPSKIPTNIPTSAPVTTRNPTIKPTGNTLIPTTLTLNPTNNPTITPTDVTQIPTKNTKIPTNIPTIQPSNNPTNNPTFNPSNIPTNLPTNNPSITPTDNPSLVPTLLTVLPSKAPVVSPTHSPTIPTAIPTDHPSIPPTKIPTNNPSIPPTINPTINPTVYPTNIPTNIPTNNPTNIPSKIPTNNPTNTPTVIPTKIPTINPTNIPTNNPTINPSLIPTNNPTTKNPTNLPTKNPTLNPSNIPTINPTFNPSNFPTKIPTKLPSITPTLNTNEPTLIPSETPTFSPSNSPTITPTSSTNIPTINTNQPTLKTLTPTLVPSFNTNFTNTLPPTTCTGNSKNWAMNFAKHNAAFKLFTSCNATYFIKFKIISIRERSKYWYSYNSVYSFLIKDYYWLNTECIDITNNGITKCVNKFVGNLQFGCRYFRNIVPFNLTTEFYYDRNIIYISEDNSNIEVPQSSVKYNIEIGDWPFRSRKNKLEVKIYVKVGRLKKNNNWYKPGIWWSRWKWYGLDDDDYSDSSSDDLSEKKQKIKKKEKKKSKRGSSRRSGKGRKYLTENENQDYIEYDIEDISEHETMNIDNIPNKQNKAIMKSINNELKKRRLSSDKSSQYDSPNFKDPLWKYNDQWWYWGYYNGNQPNPFNKKCKRYQFYVDFVIDSPNEAMCDGYYDDGYLCDVDIKTSQWTWNSVYITYSFPYFKKSVWYYGILYLNYDDRQPYRIENPAGFGDPHYVEDTSQAFRFRPWVDDSESTIFGMSVKALFWTCIVLLIITIIGTIILCYFRKKKLELKRINSEMRLE